jgi:hypothetical protein
MQKRQFYKMSDGRWELTGRWLSETEAKHTAKELKEEYPTAEITGYRDYASRFDGWSIKVIFKDDADEAEFIIKEST